MARRSGLLAAPAIIDAPRPDAWLRRLARCAACDRRSARPRSPPRPPARARRRRPGAALRAPRPSDPSDRSARRRPSSRRPATSGVEHLARRGRRASSRISSRCARRNPRGVRRPFGKSNSCWMIVPGRANRVRRNARAGDRCCTAAIASAFCCCASRGRGARVSTATVTKASSGARRTMASPRVTIVGACGARASVARRAPHRAARSAAATMACRCQLVCIGGPALSDAPLRAGPSQSY